MAKKDEEQLIPQPPIDENNELNKIQAAPIQVEYGEEGSGMIFSLRPSLEFLAHENRLEHQYDYQGPKLTLQMREEMEALIDQHLNEAYQEIANELGFDVETQNGKMLFTQNGKPITMQQRLDMENMLQERFNRHAMPDNLVMVNNGRIPMLQALLGITPKPGSQVNEQDDADKDDAKRHQI